MTTPYTAASDQGRYCITFGEDPVGGVTFKDLQNVEPGLSTGHYDMDRNVELVRDKIMIPLVEKIKSIHVKSKSQSEKEEQVKIDQQIIGKITCNLRWDQSCILLEKDLSREFKLCTAGIYYSEAINKLDENHRVKGVLFAIKDNTNQKLYEYYSTVSKKYTPIFEGVYVVPFPKLIIGCIYRKSTTQNNRWLPDPLVDTIADYLLKEECDFTKYPCRKNIPQTHNFLHYNRKIKYPIEVVEKFRRTNKIKQSSFAATLSHDNKWVAFLFQNESYITVYDRCKNYKPLRFLLPTGEEYLQHISDSILQFTSDGKCLDFFVCCNIYEPNFHKQLYFVRWTDWQGDGNQPRILQPILSGNDPRKANAYALSSDYNKLFILEPLLRDEVRLHCFDTIRNTTIATHDIVFSGPSQHCHRLTNNFYHYMDDPFYTLSLSANESLIIINIMYCVESNSSPSSEELVYTEYSFVAYRWY